MAASSKTSRSGARFIFLGVFIAVVIALHIPLLELPYLWDELGQYVPAALDIYQHNAWVSVSTAANIHPPGLMAYLAAVWTLVGGYSIVATRVAMLVLAGLTVFVSFLVAIELLRGVRGAPAFTVILFLLSAPLFYMQSMLVLLDLPAALFTLTVLLLFLRRQWAWSAAACVALVMCKETGIVVPLLFGGWLWYYGHRRTAMYFAAAPVALAAWVLLIRSQTGSSLGDPWFAYYNLVYPLHPVRLGVALLRRCYFLFVADGHWIGTLALVVAWPRLALFRTPSWRLTGLLMLVHALLVTALGGAVLERYLLPILPLLYTAFAAAFAALSVRWERMGVAALCLLLIGGNWWNPPYPFPFENNLAGVDFVRLQESAASFVSHRFPQARVATAWPTSDALRRPEFGYVAAPMTVVALTNLTATQVLSMPADRADVLLLYTRTWNPEWSILRLPWVASLLHRFYGYEPEPEEEEIAAKLGLHRLFSWERRGQTMVVYVRAEQFLGP